jgi:hypothetical protein
MAKPIIPSTVVKTMIDCPRLIEVRPLVSLVNLGLETLDIPFAANVLSYLVIR